MSLTLRAKAVVPSPLWDVLKKVKRVGVRAMQHSAAAVGLNIDRMDDFFSPLPVRSELLKTRALWDKPGSMAGVSYDLDAIKGRFGDLIRKWGGELRELPRYEECKRSRFGWGYPLLDALTVYCMIRELKPRRYMEVGSGLSTYYCGMAARRNHAEGRPLQMACVEPYPFPALSEVPGIELSVCKVEELDVKAFDTLEAGDVLFIDSSHALKVGSDVAFLMLEVVPRVKAGVFIHIHDVPFPYNTPYPSEEFLFDRNWPHYFNEAMVVQAFLAFNRNYEIYISTPMLRHFAPGFVEQVIDAAGAERDSGTYSSLWLRKTSD
jgi:hypothetical protein